MRALRRLLLPVLVTALAGASARAQEATPPVPPLSPAEREAREHFQKGETHYQLGRFDEAVVEYKAAYELSRRPGLLFNIAQAYRLGGHFADAAYFYRTYLRLVPDAPNRADVEALAAESEQKAAAEADAAEARADHARRDRERAEADAAHERRHAEHARAARKKRTAGWLTLGAGAVVAGVGGVFAVKAAQAADDLTRLAVNGGAWTSEYDQLETRGERDDAIGTSLVVLGGAAMAAGLGLVLWGTWDGEAAPARMTLAPASGGATLWLDARF